MGLHRYMGHQTPPPKSSCRRQNALLNSKAGETHLKGQTSKSAKDARPRRVELRRIRSVSQAKSAAEKQDENQTRTIQGTSEDLSPDVDVVGGESGRVRCKSYGKISVVGRRREMEDVVAVELGFLKRSGESYDFFGVYDGHWGWRVAHAYGQMLHKMLAKIVEEESREEIDWEEVMAAGFNMMDAELNRKGVMVKTTAVVAVVGENEVVVAANCGGSRVVLSHEGAAVQLLDDHKPHKDDALKRNEASRRDFISWKEAEVRVMKRNHADEFLILGSDGFWDVISDEVACQVARRCLYGGGCPSARADGGDTVEEGDETISESGGAEAAAALLAELAIARGSRDNISTIVVNLKGTYMVR